MTQLTSVRSVRPKWTKLAVVCQKCPAGRDVRKSLRKALKARGTCDVRVVRSSCLDVCPKRGATVTTVDANGDTRTVVLVNSIVDDVVLDGIGL
jgi:hypothetical protein